ncbi:MAG: hypothetical protein M1337_04800 [Actinobacteria bacterium]|nr:hypothetical protein [Actinomycetota bacterium]
MLTITDTGCGMTTETLAHVFDPFFTTKEQEPGTLLREDTEEPLEGIGKPATTLVVPRLVGQVGEEMAEVLAGVGQEAAVGGDAGDGLSHAEGDHLGIGRPPSGVSRSLWQKIIGCAINDGAESVEIGVHRGLRVDGVLRTADFGLSVLFSLEDTAIAVESII